MLNCENFLEGILFLSLSIIVRAQFINLWLTAVMKHLSAPHSHDDTWQNFTQLFDLFACVLRTCISKDSYCRKTYICEANLIQQDGQYWFRSLLRKLSSLEYSGRVQNSLNKEMQQSIPAAPSPPLLPGNCGATSSSGREAGRNWNWLIHNQDN